MAVESKQTPQRSKLGEDWLATIIGLALVAIIALGFIGSGPQKASLLAPAGTEKTVEARAIGGWSVSAKIGGEAISIAGLITRLEDGMTYMLACEDGTITASPATAGDSIQKGYAGIHLVNHCDAEVSIAYRIDSAIPWPIFGIFG